MLAVVTCALTMSAMRSPAAAAANPIGAHSMLQLNSPSSFMQAMFAEATAMHASAIRLDVAPALVFPSQSGPPDFTGLDEVMALSQRYHLRVIADLFTVPTWLAGCSAAGAVAESRCAPASYTGYGSIIGRIVAHADPVIRDWEIGNEPDTTEFFTGTPQQYATMLRAAHDAIKAVDSQALVLLGGMSGSSAMDWLSQVLATPGADAVHAFDIANVHERGWLDGLVGDLVGWRWFLAGHGFRGPIWVTEHGYPSDRAFQFDPHYTSGGAAQAAYLTASIPSLVDAGAEEVFVTERDNLGGPYASEGVLGGNVSDPPVANPQVVQRTAYAAVAHLADCYRLLGRDCPAGGPVAVPATVAMRAVRLGTSINGTVTVANPTGAPLMLGSRTLSGTTGLSVARDGCPAVLEPDQTCAVAVRFVPAAPGGGHGLLKIPSDGGLVSVPVSSVAISVSGLSSPQLPVPRFSSGPGGHRVGAAQQLVLRLTNPLPATVHVGVASLSGPDAARFRLVANTCRGVHLRSGRSCAITVSFVPSRLGSAVATLTLSGDGLPLTVPLKTMASGPPAITLLTPAQADRQCPAASVVVMTSQPSSVTWSAVRSSRPPNPWCRRARRAAAGVPARTSLRGRSRTSRTARVIQRRRGYAATVTLGSSLRPGVYRLTATPDNAHGLGAARGTWVTVSR